LPPAAAEDNGERLFAACRACRSLDPAEMFPGLWMSIRGIQDAAERQSLVRFLADPSSR
jgi:cytochrome c